MSIADLTRQVIALGDNPLLQVPEEYLTDEQKLQAAELKNQIDAIQQQRAVVITRIGEKLELLRTAMISQGRGVEFAKFRFSGRVPEYPIEDYHQEGFAPGGVYMQSEDDRERMVDEKCKEVGIEV